MQEMGWEGVERMRTSCEKGRGQMQMDGCGDVCEDAKLFGEFRCEVEVNGRVRVGLELDLGKRI